MCPVCSGRFVRATGLVFSSAVNREKPPQAPHFMLWGSRALNTSYNSIYGQYSGFVGAPQFRAICCLLGYQVRRYSTLLLPGALSPCWGCREVRRGELADSELGSGGRTEARPESGRVRCSG